MRKTLLALSLLTGSLLMPLQAQAQAQAQAQTTDTSTACQEFKPSRVSFESDEVLFTALAWLHWIGDREEELDLREFDTIQSDLLREIARTPALKRLEQKHRAAYDAYLKDWEPYTKNGLFLTNTLFYGPAPAFKLPTPDQITALSADDQERLQDLPAGELLAEFYQVMNLKQRWPKHYKPAYDKYLHLYRTQALTGIQRAQCFLKVAPVGPVTVLFNPLDSFGTAGQTSYDPLHKRHIVKLHISIKYTTPESIEAVAAHEYTHALMNHHLEPLRQAFAQKFAVLAKTVGQPELAHMPIQELFARSVENLPTANNSATDLDFHAFYESNPILLHLHAQQDAYLKSGKSFEHFLPSFLQSYDPEQSSRDWQALSQRIELKAFSSEKNLKGLQSYGFSQADIFAAIKTHEALIIPKLKAFYTQSGATDPPRSPASLVFQGFAEAGYVGNDPDIRENVFYIYKNPLYFHFSEKLAQHKVALTADAFIQDLFTSFDPAAEASRWQAVGKRLAESE